MKFNHLRFFVAVVEYGGVGKAATRLGISQPAVSAGIKALEEELGQPLFERDGPRRAVRLTTKAWEFHKEAVEILNRCDFARAQFRRKDVRRTLRIGLLPTIASRHVAAFTHAVAMHDPELQLELREGSPIRLLEWLRGGRIDGAWTVIDAAGKNTRELWKEPYVVLVPPKHRLSGDRRSRLSFSDLDGENLILRAWCEAPKGSLWPANLRMRVVARAERDELALRLVAEGVGIAIAPQSLATEDVVVRKVQDLHTSRSIGFRWRGDLEDEKLDTALRALLSVQ
jgi:DNA-binding transcriptional LysR family regulator